MACTRDDFSHLSPTGAKLGDQAVSRQSGRPPPGFALPLQYDVLIGGDIIDGVVRFAREHNVAVIEAIHHATRRGVEQHQNTTEKTPISTIGGAKSGAPSATCNNPQPSADARSTTKPTNMTPAVTPSPAPCINPQLQQLTDAWPTLPKAIRLGILAMIQATKA